MQLTLHLCNDNEEKIRNDIFNDEWFSVVLRDIIMLIGATTVRHQTCQSR